MPSAPVSGRLEPGGCGVVWEVQFFFLSKGWSCKGLSWAGSGAKLRWPEGELAFRLGGPVPSRNIWQACLSALSARQHELQSKHHARSRALADPPGKCHLCPGPCCLARAVCQCAAGEVVVDKAAGELELSMILKW